MNWTVICGREEMARWNPLEVCQLRHTTKDLFGALADYLPTSTREDEIHYVKLSLGNLYHEICHRYIHADREKNTAKLRDTCKSVFFLIQNLHYLESGRFILTRKALKEAVSQEDRRVLALGELPDGYDFDQAFAILLFICFCRMSGNCREPFYWYTALRRRCRTAHRRTAGFHPNTAPRRRLCRPFPRSFPVCQGVPSD